MSSSTIANEPSASRAVPKKAQMCGWLSWQSVSTSAANCDDGGAAGVPSLSPPGGSEELGSEELSCTLMATGRPAHIPWYTIDMAPRPSSRSSRTSVKSSSNGTPHSPLIPLRRPRKNSSLASWMPTESPTEPTERMVEPSVVSDHSEQSASLPPRTLSDVRSLLSESRTMQPRPSTVEEVWATGCTSEVVSSCTTCRPRRLYRTDRVATP
mmetsp:Transcript_40145/g.105638  ORF Transcript_40145/g.105638 Transcript_40145/m.105638 type:complete len:211 (-) Transcript_40145:152-784(-)